MACDILQMNKPRWEKKGDHIQSIVRAAQKRCPSSSNWRKRIRSVATSKKLIPELKKINLLSCNILTFSVCLFFLILLSSIDQSTIFHYICRHTPPFQISAGHQRGLEVTGTGVRVDALGRPPCCLSLGIGLPKNSSIALVGQLSRPYSAIPSHFLDWNGMSDRQCSWVNMIASGADGYLLHLWYTSSPTFVCNTAVMECVPSLSDKKHAQTSRPALHVAFKENDGKNWFWGTWNPLERQHLWLDVFFQVSLQYSIHKFSNW